MNLPLLPATPFTEGDVWTPELAYLALYAPIRDGLTQYLGHTEKIADVELSDAAGAIKARFAAVENGLRVSVISGRNLSYASGIVRLPNGQLLTIASSNLVAPDNTTSFVWIDPVGTVAIGSTPPVVRVLLARVVTAAGAVTTLEDLRHPAIRNVAPVNSSIKVFGGTNLTDKVCTANEALDQGFYYFRNFTVPSGVSITIDRFAHIYCSGTVDIQGTITVTPAANGAQGYVTNVPPGITVGGISGSGIGAGSGSGNGPLPYNYAAQPYGSGGSLGFAATSGSLTVGFGTGGPGGGGLKIEASGFIFMSSSASIIARGGNGTANLIVTGTNAAVSGNGAGSGGLVLLSSLLGVNLATGATVDVRGGNGSNGLAVGAGGTALGGGAGAGGVVAIFSPNTNTSGANILIAGGSIGAPAGTGGNLGGGNGASFGGQGGSGSGGNAAQPGRIFLLSFVPIGS